MVSSRVGTSLRSARERAGWSREALAHHSGLSWAAIAQIETGRRHQIRLGSLVALASALGVSVDYLVGNEATGLLQHDALIYDSDHEYLSSLVPFLLVGVKRSEAVLVVTTRKRIAMLREALGSDAAHVEFRNSAQFLRTPTGALTGFRRFVNRRFEDGAAWIRILAEPVWAGRTEVEVAQWMRLESLVNLTFASSPATFICPYDGRSVAEPILANARHTHPQIAEAGGVTPSSTYLEPEEFLLTGL